MRLIIILLISMISFITNANTLTLDNGFVASTNSESLYYYGPSTNSFTTWFSNDEVTLSNSNGPFNLYSWSLNSFYQFDPVNVSLYSADNSLIDKLIFTSTFNYDSGIWTPSSSKYLNYTNISYIKLQSQFVLGVMANDLPGQTAITAAVPEPETYALMSIGLLGLIASRRKNKQANKY